MRITALFLAVLLCYAAGAQEISGFVNDDGGNPLGGASIALRSAKDSSLVKMNVTAGTGQYAFGPVAPGRYFIAASHIGYNTLSSAAFQIAETSAFRVPLLQLMRRSRELQMAEVAAFLPLVEVKSDRLVVHVGNTINSAAEDALTLIRKSPGVTVDNNNTISFGGKTGVQVDVDGRPTHLSGAALSDYLRTIPSSSIESIELIANPSARYEAAGSAGIVNIRLKKDQSLGTNITATAGYAVGTYSKFNGGIRFNHRDQRLNFFGDLTYRNSISVAHSLYYRTLLDSNFRQRDVLVTKTAAETWHGGIDYFLSNRSTLGVLLSGTLLTDSEKTTSNTPIIYLPGNTTDRLLVANNRTSKLQDQYDFNLNYRYTGKDGLELTLNGDYGLYHLRSSQLQPNAYFDSTGTKLLYSDSYRILSPTDIHIYSVNADFSQQVWKGTLAAGLKFSFVTSTNDFREYDLEDPAPSLDSLNSNHFRYKENINAGYVNYSRNFGKGPEIGAGLRVENTNGRGTTAGWQPGLPDYRQFDSSYPRHYTDLFPNLSLHWQGWTLGYSRRIDRPEYQDLNPFVYKIDDYIFAKGNTRLQPQYANNISLAWAPGNAFAATLSYAHIAGLFTTVTDTTNRSGSVNSMENLAAQDVVGLNISGSFRYKRYSAFVNLNGFHAHYSADFGPGKRIDEQVYSSTIVSQHNVNLGKDWSANLSQYLSTPAIWGATLRSRTQWSLDAGLQKTFFAGRATVRTSVSDIFHTMPWAASSKFDGQSIYTAGDNETRQFKLTFSYRFGNVRIKPARQRQTGAEEENRRVNTLNGGGAP